MAAETEVAVSARPAPPDVSPDATYTVHVHNRRYVGVPVRMHEDGGGVDFLIGEALYWYEVSD